MVRAPSWLHHSARTRGTMREPIRGRAWMGCACILQPMRRGVWQRGGGRRRSVRRGVVDAERKEPRDAQGCESGCIPRLHRRCARSRVASRSRFCPTSDESLSTRGMRRWPKLGRSASAKSGRLMSSWEGAKVVRRVAGDSDMNQNRIIVGADHDEHDKARASKLVRPKVVWAKSLPRALLLSPHLRRLTNLGWTIPSRFRRSPPPRLPAQAQAQARARSSASRIS